MKKKLKALLFRLKRRHICEHEHCLNEGSQCRLTNYSDNYKTWKDEYYWYCTEHAHINGFCWYCGEFWGGCEAFDFNRNGLCPNCKDEVNSELESDFEDEMADFYQEVF